MTTHPTSAALGEIGAMVASLGGPLLLAGAWLASATIGAAAPWQRAIAHLVATNRSRLTPTPAMGGSQARASTGYVASIEVLAARVDVATRYLAPMHRRSSWRLVSTVIAHLPMPLELGLDIRPGRSRSSQRSPVKGMAKLMNTELRFGSGKDLGAEVGDPALEQRYFLHAYEPGQLQAILTAPIRASLVDAWRSATVSVTDRYVQLERYGHVDEAFAVWAIHDAAWLARALTEAARHVPLSARLRPFLPAMKQVAAQTGFALTTTPLGMRGKLHGFDVALLAFRDESTEQYGLRLQAAFPHPLGLGLHLRPAEDGTFGFLRPRDVQIGDRLLDDKLDIHATDPVGVQAAFDANARALLHHLRDRGRVYIDDHSVSLESLGSVHPQDLLPTLHRVRDLAAVLSNAAHARRVGAAPR